MNKQQRIQKQRALADKSINNLRIAYLMIKGHEMKDDEGYRALTKIAGEKMDVAEKKREEYTTLKHKMAEEFRAIELEAEEARHAVEAYLEPHIPEKFRILEEIEEETE